MTDRNREKSMIEIKNLTKKYFGKTALDGVSLKIGRGEIIGLFGENGAGKTTLIKSVLGLLSFSGEVTIDGEIISAGNISRLSFATSEHSFFPNLSAAGHAEFYREHFLRFNEKRFKGLMEFFELPMNKRIRNFSMGQKNQFEVILALSQGAEYIFMDEPFAGSDLFNREDFYKVLLGILEPDETVVLSTHLIEEVAGFIGRAVLIHKGKIIGDSEMEELETEGKSLAAYVKETYNYRANRVGQAIEDIIGAE